MSMASARFKNAQIVLPKCIIKDTFEIEGGVFTAVGEGAEAGEDLQGDYVLPGLVDLQINGGGGMYFNDCTSADQVTHILKANLATGTTTLLPTLTLNPVPKMLQQVRILVAHANSDGARVAGLHVEGPFLNPEYRGIHPLEHIVAPSVDITNEFIAAGKGKIKVMTLAPELSGSLDVIALLKQNNIIASMGHSLATAAQTHTALQAGAGMATHLYNRMSAVHHHPGKAGMIPVLLNSKAACGLIADLAHINDDLLLMTLNVNGANLFLVSDGIAPLGTHDADFTFHGEHMHVKNGACYNDEGRLAGSATPLLNGIINAHKLGFPLHEMVARASLVPAQLIGMADQIGSIAVGKRADFLIVDKNDFKLKAVYKDGVRFEAVFNL